MKTQINCEVINMVTMIKTLVDDFHGLSLEDQEYAAEIIKKLFNYLFGVTSTSPIQHGG
jgi:hypothetical protein